MPEDITSLLDQWGNGDRSALDRLAPMVYPQLRAMAEACFRSERPDHTLDAGALVSELFLKLMARKTARFENRRHFYSLCARLMRLALIDYARSAKAEKRGGELQFVALHEELPWVNARSEQVIALDAALEELAGIEPRQVEMIEVRYMAGCSTEETAELLGVSRSTVDRELRDARAWLYLKLKPLRA